MKNNVDTENQQLQELQKIFDEYLEERAKTNSSSIVEEFLRTLAGEPDCSEKEILKFRKEIDENPDYKDIIISRLELLQEKKEWLARMFFRFSVGTFSGILVSIAVNFWLFPNRPDFIFLGFFALFAIVTLSVSIVFFLSANRYKVLISKINP